MIETKVEIPAIGAEALFLRPDDIADFPGVVFLTDVWGIRPANIGVAKRLCERGFSVLMPNVFHRYSRMTPDGFEHGSPEEKTKALHALFQALTPDNMRGRVISVQNVAFRGGMPVGSLVVGALVKQFTAPVVLTWNGVLLTLLALYFLLVHRKVATL